MSLFSEKKSRTRRVLGSIIDVRVDRWLSLDFLKTHSKQVLGIAQSLFKRPERPVGSGEDFETARDRLGLTENELRTQQQRFLQLSWVYAGFGLLLLGYALYMAYQIALGAMLLSICLAVYAFSQAFSFHFWYFQVKKRKLGCTFQDWLNG